MVVVGKRGLRRAVDPGSQGAAVEEQCGRTAAAGGEEVAGEETAEVVAAAGGVEGVWGGGAGEGVFGFVGFGFGVFAAAARGCSHGLEPVVWCRCIPALGADGGAL